MLNQEQMDFIAKIAREYDLLRGPYQENEWEGYSFAKYLANELLLDFQEPGLKHYDGRMYEV